MNFISSFQNFEDLFDQIKYLSLYEYYDNLEVSVELMNNEKIIGLIPEDCCFTESSEFVKQNLHKMINLQSFSYTSKFQNETTFDFLLSKPASLKILRINHLEGLDLNFLNGIEYLHLDMFDDSFEEIYYDIPNTIKFVEFECSDYEYDEIEFPADLSYQIVFTDLI
jgi:hypothetical protein